MSCLTTQFGSMIAFMKWKRTAAALLTAAMMTACASAGAPAQPAASAAAAVTEETKPVQITNQVEFEVLQDPADMTGYKWMTAKDTSFKEISLKESIRFFTEGGTGILVYSAPTCPFCNRAMPVLDDVLAEYGIKACYVDTSQPIAPDQEQSMKLYLELTGYISSIFEKDEDGNPMFQIPEVIAGKDGKIVGHHLSLVDSFTILDEDTQMDDAQTEELKQIYRDLIEACAD